MTRQGEELSPRMRQKPQSILTFHAHYILLAGSPTVGNPHTLFGISLILLLKSIVHPTNMHWSQRGHVACWRLHSSFRGDWDSHADGPNSVLTLIRSAPRPMRSHRSEQPLCDQRKGCYRNLGMNSPRVSLKLSWYHNQSNSTLTVPGPSTAHTPHGVCLHPPQCWRFLKALSDLDTNS